jgi:simple sugar transport system ATP-binding protein
LRAPVDFDAAIEAMIGRSLAAMRPEGVEGSLASRLSLRDARLHPDTLPFDLDLREGEVVA